MVREIQETELTALLELYLHLHEDSVPEMSRHLNATWEQILQDKNYHIIVKVVDNRIVSSCVCVVIPNLTRSIRPYALIENVVTHPDHRQKGYATECLNYAKEISLRENCYKIMLLTSSKDEATHRFYRNAGYSSNDKAAFVQRIE